MRPRQPARAPRAAHRERACAAMGVPVPAELLPVGRRPGRDPGAVYHARRCALATAALAEHRLVARDDAAGRWRLRRADGAANHWAEVVALHMGGLLVCGDVDTVAFGGFGGDGHKPGAPGHLPWALALVRWLGEHPLADGYVAGKAAQGMGGRHVGVYTTDDAVAHAQLRRERRAARREGVRAAPAWARHDARCSPVWLRGALGLERRCGYAEALERALEVLADRSVEAATHALYDEAGDQVDLEWLAGVGRVLEPRVYYAHAVVRRLWTLLHPESRAARTDGSAAR